MNDSRTKAAPGLALPWIIGLRYSIAAGQMAAAIGVHYLLGISLPLLWLAIPLVLVAASNFWLAKRTASSADSTLIAGAFVLDTLCLTAVLMLTGGPNNPFTMLYLVHITLSATILTRRQTWFLGLLACVCYALLFWWYRPIPQLEMHHHGDGASLHLVGMWVGFAVATSLVTLFAGKISELLREREDSLLRMQEQLAKKDRLAALMTLAAGAAHELNTPLGTIAVVAKELEHYATRTARDGAIAEDSRLIRTEVERCREILLRMSAHGAEPAGEALEDVPVSALLSAIENKFAPGQTVAVATVVDTAACSLRIPRHAVQQALAALIKNAIEASPAGSLVRLQVKREGAKLRFEVCDQGTGMTEECLRHAGEPFFTTKEPGKGMGLGIFLARTLADHLGGKLTINSALHQGTVAVLELPA